ncbi:hypothetical protein [Buttiauxella agrestis]|uniref:hypothetical protein n=1 Tax=Buttiauxella agrestis TaxID=82977 RepID=UPI003976313C
MDKGIKLQTYKQRHGHDINGVRPVMIPDESGEWVSRHDAEHLAAQLQQALSRNAELEAASTMREPSALCVKPLCVKLPDYRNSPDMHTKQYYEAIGFNQGLDDCAEVIRAAGGAVEGSE